MTPVFDLVEAKPQLQFSHGNARRELEKKSGRKVVTNESCLALTQAVKKAKL